MSFFLGSCISEKLSVAYSSRILSSILSLINHSLPLTAFPFLYLLDYTSVFLGASLQCLQPEVGKGRSLALLLLVLQLI